MSAPYTEILATDTPTGVGDAGKLPVLDENGRLAQGFMPAAMIAPSMTTAERDALTPAAGWVIFNTTTSKHQGFDGALWQDFY